MAGMIIAWVVVGGIAGWLASLLVRGGGLGIVGDVFLGIVGGIVGGVIVNVLGAPGVTGLNFSSLIVAFLGALTLLLLMRLLGAGVRNV